jgi:hypothetical protein
LDPLTANFRKWRLARWQDALESISPKDLPTTVRVVWSLRSRYRCGRDRFAARELLGPQAFPRDAVYIDLWEDYLERA